MFVQMSKQLEQAEQDLIAKADKLNAFVANTKDEMAVAIKVVFKTLSGQLESLEKEAWNIPTGLRLSTPNNYEDWELESRKHLARF